LERLFRQLLSDRRGRHLGSAEAAPAVEQPAAVEPAPTPKKATKAAKPAKATKVTKDVTPKKPSALGRIKALLIVGDDPNATVVQDRSFFAGT
jgi:hypothetical protein